VKRLMMERTRRVVVLAGSGKFERMSPVTLAALNEVHTIVTDDGLPLAIRAHKNARNGR
jgi:DeoR/GlpR family transcriptional regulator of sugar metabolism